MNDAKATQEPSMEEILASIRRIISEEGNADDASEKKPEPPVAPPPPAAAAPPPPPPPPPPEEEEDLVLTDEVEEVRWLLLPAHAVRHPRGWRPHLTAFVRAPAKLLRLRRRPYGD